MALRYGARMLARSVKMPVYAAPKFNFTTFAEREAGEEARYIRSMETDRQSAMKVEMERILALEDHHEDKKELLDLLGMWFIFLPFS